MDGPRHPPSIAIAERPIAFVFDDGRLGACLVGLSVLAFTTF